MLDVQTAHKGAVVEVTAGVEVGGQGPAQQVKVTTPSLNQTTTDHQVDSDETLVSVTFVFVRLGFCLSLCL